MTEETTNPECVLCGKADSEVPLLKLSYKKKELYLCAEHMPMLIHQPTTLIGKLPGAENMNAG